MTARCPECSGDVVGGMEFHAPYCSAAIPSSVTQEIAPVRAPEPVAVTREELATFVVVSIEKWARHTSYNHSRQTWLADALLSKFNITQKVSHEST